MNAFQAVWLEQVRADHAMLVRLRELDAAPCHQLHYLQMVTGKLGKAYFWRSHRAPRKSHGSFVPFLKALLDRNARDRSRIAELFRFRRTENLRDWVRNVLPLAHELENLAPALARNNGPNPEYPWPHDAPTVAPVSFDFPIWPNLTQSGRGRQLLQVIDQAVRTFPSYA